MGSVFTFLFPVLLLAMGVYVLISAIKGSGRLFSMENFKDETKDQAKKIMRGIYFGLAAIMLLMALTNTLSSVLYSNKVIFFKITDEYTKAFPDLTDEDGTLYTVNAGSNNSLGSFALDENGNKIPMKDADQSKLLPWYDSRYNLANDKMDQNVCFAFIQNAMNIYGNDTSKFPQTQSSIMSCAGASVDYSKYYNYTYDLNDNGEPIYGGSSNGHTAYYSLFSKTRSDAKSDSFAGKLYGAFSQTLLSVLNYVFLGLALLGVVAVFLVTRKFTDKEKLQKAREQQVRPAMPSDAFNFEDEEPKQNAMKDDK